MKPKGVRMISDLLTISKNLQKFMDSKNLSLLELSEMLGKPSSTVHGWPNGMVPKNIGGKSFRLLFKPLD
jgi:transcriptional regulator with XRE-family HTH domain